MIVVDTDIVVDILRGYEPAITWLESILDQEIGLPGFVVMELLQGCQTKRDTRSLEKKLNAFRVLWPSDTDCSAAVSSFATLYLSHRIGIIDTLIAYTAIGAGEALHTFNRKHYSPITPLRTIQPYRKNKR